MNDKLEKDKRVFYEEFENANKSLNIKKEVFLICRL